MFFADDGQGMTSDDISLPTMSLQNDFKRT
jgi:hypothetical protein